MVPRAHVLKRTQVTTCQVWLHEFCYLSAILEPRAGQGWIRGCRQTTGAVGMVSKGSGKERLLSSEGPTEPSEGPPPPRGASVCLSSLRPGMRRRARGSGGFSGGPLQIQGQANQGLSEIGFGYALKKTTCHGIYPNLPLFPDQIQKLTFFGIGMFSCGTLDKHRINPKKKNGDPFQHHPQGSLLSEWQMELSEKAPKEKINTEMPIPNRLEGSILAL